ARGRGDGALVAPAAAWHAPHGPLIPGSPARGRCSPRSLTAPSGGGWGRGEGPLRTACCRRGTLCPPLWPRWGGALRTERGDLLRANRLLRTPLRPGRPSLRAPLRGGGWCTPLRPDGGSRRGGAPELRALGGLRLPLGKLGRSR